MPSQYIRQDRKEGDHTIFTSIDLEVPVKEPYRGTSIQ